MAGRKSARPTSAAAEREPHRVDHGLDRPIANREQTVGQDLARSNSLTDLAVRIRREHEAAANQVRRGLEHGINAGRLLLEAKAQVEHGQWLEWLRDYCYIPERTSQLYMRLAVHAEEFKSATVADLRGAVALIAKKDR